MDKNEQKLSDFIDRLNAEKKPDDHENSTDSEELKELFHTVIQIRSLKEPTMPGPDYQKKLTHSVKNKLTQKSPVKYRKLAWITAIASVAAILALMMNIISPFGTTIVNAMDKAFSEVEAYHGSLEIVATNANGESNTQAKMDVWSNKDGHYYTKGLEGSYKDLITVNNGQKKWQIQPNQKQVHVFPAFPDSYHFIFELGNEIEKVKNALSTKEIGDDKIAGREAYILEVTPQGGLPYQIWIDQETKLPLQKQTAMHNGIQYTITYTQIDFNNAIPEKLTSYHVPNGFKEVDTNPEQFINDMNEVQATVGFIPKTPEGIPNGYFQDSLAVIPNKKLTKTYYVTRDTDKRVIVIQGKSVGEFKPVSNAILGKINNSLAEIQSPVHEDAGVLGGGGIYAGGTDVTSIRWWQDGYEFVVVGNASLEELESFTKSLANGAFEMPSIDEELATKPKVDVSYDLTVEENDQKSVDAGSSPWKLDPTFVAQVFVSLQISPEGITGDYPIDMEDLKVIQNTGSEAIIEVHGDKTPVKNVYLKRVVRQDSTGIWTVVGYDPIDKN